MPVPREATLFVLFEKDRLRSSVFGFLKVAQTNANKPIELLRTKINRNPEVRKPHPDTSVLIVLRAWSNARRSSWPRMKRRRRQSDCPAKQPSRACRATADHRAARPKRKTRPCRHG